MAKTKLSRVWVLITVLLVAIIIIGGAVIWLRYRPSQPLEISVPQVEDWQGSIYIGGAVSNPGFYPFLDDDSIETLIQAAGGITSGANLTELELYVAEVGEERENQKIDINRAEVWLLEALPGIGPTLAQRIVDYRQEYGPFQNINELLKVDGIGAGILEQIEDLITVADHY